MQVGYGPFTSRFQGTEAIQGIRLNLVQSYETRWRSKAFLRTTQLKFLNLDGLQLPMERTFLPSSLKVLQWRGFSSQALPLTDEKYEFISIELSHSKIEKVWHGKKLLEKLKHMDLSFSKNLKVLSNFSGAPNLDTLNLEGCTSLTKVHASILRHKNLVLMNLKDCKSLEFLPGELEMSSLKELILTGCSKFEIVPKMGKCMKVLSKFSLGGTAIRKLPTSLEFLIGLEVLNLKDCKKLVSLPDTLCGLKCLKILDISGCSKLCKLPKGLEEMNSMQELLASGTVIEFNESSVNSHFLKWLFGSQPTSIPPSILNLSSLSVMDLSYCNLSEDSIPHDFWLLSSLVFLDLSGNNFVAPPTCIPKLSKLEVLRLNRCGKLQMLPELPSSIRTLDASNCHSLQAFNPSTLFVSLTQHPPKVCFLVLSESLASHARFDMVIPGCEIPSWFVHQENGRYVSVHHDQCVGIALCFLLVSYADPSEECSYLVKCSLADRIANKYKRYISERKLPPMDLPHLYVIFLTDDQLSHEILQHTTSHFGLTNVPHLPKLVDLNIVSCGACLVHKP
ncbi:hypothetical protein VNO77_20987 [Canavalia gladiata]|uniref:Disease resistance protein RPS4B/Roq1-like leucine-rich repeats domain-containing protein n=1 Tax=Canavalia gladiata TaxID=3824 RepID=A0AAN9LQ88_CANGL